ncbi:MAG: undecaprenyldiphospho-muramoylpentapeptide beta-N-acetylglucosaminyltransferase [Spongiibacteraceae bacterium]|jgi:UDP-N-acetylglucosamine--N-acetylmuramyl-(pentapeptide) pyrophosphoryl-undecaprenol N-acetylglucosamine transferase|nr:undecaprenyldiphospho-muramoylpentapeptide beta-N-acetylglucosaminyltransferase [Spongiibacteraceae bacterium]
MAERVLIMAGGTGGHVFPALAVANELLRRGVEVHWLGTARGIEAEVVPQAGIPLHFIRVTGLRGKQLRTVLAAPVRLVRALFEAIRVIRTVRPACVVGFGGFASGPGGLAAWLLRRPLLIHEQNAVAGTTNRLLALFARRILLGFPDALESEQALQVGNPVRREIAQLPAPELRWQERAGPLRLLVLGGSLGARAINERVPAAVAAMPPALRPEIWHQTGREHVADVTADYAAHGIEARVVPFIADMAEAYGWADVALCRAGALTVAELAAAGLGALLVPLPHAIDDHQRHNALWLVAQGGARLLPQSELTAPALAQLLTELATKPQQLLGWACAARAAATPDAAQVVADHCMEVADARAA